MNTWAPLWSMIVDSSLWEEPYHVRVLFVTMMALKDADSVVRYDGYKLSKKAHIEPLECVDGLKVLSRPDKRRKPFECLETQDFDGRRIEKVKDGWLILNGPKYRELMQIMGNRRYKTDWERRKRQKQNGSVFLTEEEAEVYKNAKGLSLRKRLKVVENMGECSGAREAIEEGLAEAMAGKGRERVPAGVLLKSTQG